MLESDNPVTTPQKFAISTAHGELTEHCEILSQQLSLPVLPYSEFKSSNLLFALIVEPHEYQYQLALHQLTIKSNPIVVDFNSDSLNYRIQHGGGKKQAIAKAVGIKPGKYPTVLDACAGLGKDAYILAALGCNVTMLERNPIVGALLNDGVRRLQQSSNPIAHRIKAHSINSITYLSNPANTLDTDVIYLDPMYPHRSKSALVKKEMRVLRQFVGDDEDISELISSALGTQVKRIVLKRPDHATIEETNQKPSHCIESKNTRYDVYLRPEF